MKQLNHEYYLILDSGTSSSKVFVVSRAGSILFSERQKHALERPAPFCVESNAEHTFAACHSLLERAYAYVRSREGKIRRIGLTVQRSTFLFWHKKTCQPHTPALNWQDSRARDLISRWESYRERIQHITGIPLSAHFGGPKYAYFTEEFPELKQNDDLWFGPLSAYLCHRFTGQARVDESIAGRSLLFAIDSASWSQEMMDLFQVSPAHLPPLGNTVQPYGTIRLGKEEIPLSCIIGDQQAALIGQGGDASGQLAMNFGTSGSVQLNTGEQPAHISTLLANVLSSNDRRIYLLEGTINACNSLFYWLESELDIPHHKMVWHERCAQTETEGVLIPGFVGLAAPYWQDGFSTQYFRLSGNADEVVRAGMESIGFLVHDIYREMGSVLSGEQPVITASGGGARLPLLQFIANLLQQPVALSSLKDRTAMGVFRLLRHLDDGDFHGTGPAYDEMIYPSENEAYRRKKLAAWRLALSGIGL
ncbi:MAG: FGGY family carbohydrate kinase [Fidelibacterota bacterium]